MGGAQSSEFQEEWMKIVIAQLSPRIGEFGASVLVDEIEPLIQRLLARSARDSGENDQGGESHSNKFKFEKTDLGTMPPRLTSVFAHSEDSSKQVVLDFDVEYLGDCDLQVSILGVRSGVRDVQMSGRARLSLKPTLSNLPFVGGIQLCFLEEPKIGFDMEGLGNICDWPGLRRKVRLAILEDMCKHCVYPNRLSLALSSQADLEEVKGFTPKGVLFVRMVRGSGLPKKGGLRSALGQGKPDTYIKLRVGATEHVTHTVKNSREPNWEEEWFEFPMETFVGHKLELRAYDEDRMSRDEFMGRVDVDLREVDKAEAGEITRDLVADHGEKSKFESVSGQLTLQTRWLQLLESPLGGEENMMHLEPSFPGQKTLGIFSVFVYSCNNVAELSEHEAPTTRKSLHPQFGFGANFSLQHEDLSAAVADIRVIEKLGESMLAELQLPAHKLLSAPEPMKRRLFQLERLPNQTMTVSAKITFLRAA